MLLLHRKPSERRILRSARASAWKCRSENRFGLSTGSEACDNRTIYGFVVKKKKKKTPSRHSPNGRNCRLSNPRLLVRTALKSLDNSFRFIIGYTRWIRAFFYTRAQTPRSVEPVHREQSTTTAIASRSYYRARTLTIAKRFSLSGGHIRGN